MKSYLSLLSAITMLLGFAVQSHAWTATVTNKCGYSNLQYSNGNTSLTVYIYGHHLFWSQSEGLLLIRPGETKTFTLPGLLCNSSAKIDNTNSSAYCLGGLPCCWNVNYEITSYKGMCYIDAK